MDGPFVFIVRDGHRTGGLRVYSELAAALAREGHEVVLALLPFSPRRRLSFVSRFVFVVRGADASFFSKGNAPPYQMFIHDESELKSVCQRARGVFASSPDALSLALRVAPREVVFHFAQGHEIIALVNSDSASRWNEEIHQAWRAPVRRLVVSEWLRRIAGEEYGDEGAAVFSPGIDSSKFTDEHERPAMSVGLVYSRDAAKGPDVAIEALRRVTRKHPSVLISAFGHHLPPRRVRRGLRMRFLVNPNDERIAQAYGSTRAWLWTSRREGFGLPIIESLASGTPVVASGAGAAPEILSTGGGVLVNSMDPGDFADALLHILEASEEDHRSMREVARSRGREYDWKNRVSSFLRIVQRQAN